MNIRARRILYVAAVCTVVVVIAFEITSRLA
jgi:hypothetical protein